MLVQPQHWLGLVGEVGKRGTVGSGGRPGIARTSVSIERNQRQQR